MDKDTLYELCSEAEVWFHSNVHGAVAARQFFMYSTFTVIEVHSELKRHSVYQFCVTVKEVYRNWNSCCKYFAGLLEML
jgi:hypothetical protein